jgi:hypothetical protein
MRWLKLPLVGLPLLSIAGLNLARLWRIRQVVWSSVRDPLEPVTLQPVTRPVDPICNDTVTVPCSSRSIALSG